MGVAAQLKCKCPKRVCDGPCSMVHSYQVNSKLCSVKSTSMVNMQETYLFYFSQVAKWYTQKQKSEGC
jgi:hypothetical protein